MLPFPIFLALKYLRPKRAFISAVTVISVLGVLLGVAILVIVLSVMTGFDAMWREKILSFKPHLSVTHVDGGIETGVGLAARVEEVPGVTAVAPVALCRTLVQHAGRTAAPVLVGLDPDRAAGVSRVPDFMRSGRFALEGDQSVMGLDLAMQLRLGVGSRYLAYSPLNVMRPDELTLPTELEVTGIFDLGMRDFDSGFILTSLEVGRDLSGLDDGAHALYVMTADPFRTDAIQERLRGALGPGYRVESWKEADRVLFSALSHEKTMMFVLLVFITIVAIFCVTNTLIVITVQKTHEIGLLKALGFPSWKIMAAFICHGWIQCLAGTLFGLGAGLLVLHNLKHIVAGLTALNVEVFPKEIYGLSEIPWSTSGGELTRIALFVIVFCTLSSLVPAFRAARLDPVEALRRTEG
jgi:lipoprotein-releasing system permease protein